MPNLIRFAKPLDLCVHAKRSFWLLFEGTLLAQSAQKLLCTRLIILNFLMDWFDRAPRRVFLAMSVACILLLVFGAYLQHVVGLEPCPMCIVQRYALLLIAFCAALTGATGKRGLHILGGVSVVALGASGAFVAARQSWLQWYPPEVVSCGRDLYGMIETFPLQRLVPMVFKGSGDCSKVDWTFLGGSIANWSFLWFCTIALIALALVWRQIQKR
jgi:disulfide bond formation protein DsbB